MIEQLENNELEETKLWTKKELWELKDEILQTKDKLEKVNEYLSNNHLWKKLLTNTLNDMLNSELVWFYIDENQKISFDEKWNKELIETIVKIASKIWVTSDLYIDLDWNQEIGEQDIIISQKQDLEKINPLTASTGQLLEKEKHKPWYLRESFLEPLGDNKYKVNFQTNTSAEKDMWISDILDKKIKVIKIKDTEWKSNIYTRQWIHWSFYDKDNNYWDVLNQFEIEIIEEYKNDEIKNIETQIDSKIQENLNNPKIKELYEKWDKITQERILQTIKKSLEYDVKPEVVIWLWQSENPQLWDYMWINRISVDSFEWQLTLLCRKAQILTKEYKNSSGKSEIPLDKKEAWEYLYYLWAWSTSDKKPKNIIIQLLQFIWAMFGINFGDDDFLFFQKNISQDLDKNLKYWNYNGKSYKKYSKPKWFIEWIRMEWFSIEKIPNNNSIKNFDYNSYKESIAVIESNGNYSARNDKLWKEKNVKPSNWAYWRYQFTAGTLQDYDIDMIRWNDVDKDKTNKWLWDKKLQEDVMLDYTRKNAEYLMNNYAHVIKDDKDLATLLSVCHHAWRWWVVKYIKTWKLNWDWLWWKTSNYKDRTASLYTHKKSQNWKA